jgi:hypothetical protein
MLGGEPSAVSRQDDIVLVDDDRNCEAELPDASRDLADLLLGMSARVGGVRAQLPYGRFSDSLVGIRLPSKEAV